MSKIPQSPAFFNPLLIALRELGGSGSVAEVNQKIIELMKFSPEECAISHSPENNNITEIEYRLAWARTWLKRYGLIENSTRGVWSLTSKANGVENVDPTEVNKFVQNQVKLEKGTKSKTPTETQIDDNEMEEEDWKTQLHRLLTKELSPEAFERLVQRLLRESGFIQVEVTGRTGDGGIDGKGIARIHGFMSWHVVFQCKRYSGVVGSNHIRDFRGATVGRADKGLFITTGSFTRDAYKEATRDGAPPIDLIDGDQLAEKLKELRLGVKVEMVEEVTVEAEWFLGI